MTDHQYTAAIEELGRLSGELFEADDEATNIGVGVALDRLRSLRDRSNAQAPQGEAQPVAVVPTVSAFEPECPYCDEGKERGSPGGPCSECTNTQPNIQSIARRVTAYRGAKWWKMEPEAREWVRGYVRLVLAIAGVTLPEHGPDPCPYPTICKPDVLADGALHVCEQCGRRYRGAITSV